MAVVDAPAVDHDFEAACGTAQNAPPDRASSAGSSAESTSAQGVRCFHWIGPHEKAVIHSLLRGQLFDGRREYGVGGIEPVAGLH